MDEPELSAESQTDRRRTGGERPATSRQHPTTTTANAKVSGAIETMLLVTK
jgi:hypothetical protein